MPGGRVPAKDEPAIWATFLSELWRWAAEHNDAQVPTTVVTEVGGHDFMLGSRVKNARVYYHRGSLTAERIAQLESVPGWVWGGYTGLSQRAWRKRAEALRAYADEHGSLAGLMRVDEATARWLRTQRNRPDLTPQQHAELAAIRGALETPATRLDGFIDLFHRWAAGGPDRDASTLFRSTMFRDGDVTIALGKRSWAWHQSHAVGTLAQADEVRLARLPGWTWEMPRGRPGRRAREAT